MNMVKNVLFLFLLSPLAQAVEIPSELQGLYRGFVSINVSEGQGLKFEAVEIRATVSDAGIKIQKPSEDGVAFSEIFYDKALLEQKTNPDLSSAVIYKIKDREFIFTRENTMHIRGFLDSRNLNRWSDLKRGDDEYLKAAEAFFGKIQRIK